MTLTVTVEVYVPAYAVPGCKLRDNALLGNEISYVPIPPFAAALSSFKPLAVSISPLAVVIVETGEDPFALESMATVGLDNDMESSGKVWLVELLVSCVALTSTFQPAPEPVASVTVKSPMSAVVVWSAPFNVTGAKSPIVGVVADNEPPVNEDVEARAIGAATTNVPSAEAPTNSFLNFLFTLVPPINLFSDESYGSHVALNKTDNRRFEHKPVVKEFS